jgi:hypothetical protein
MVPVGPGNQVDSLVTTLFAMRLVTVSSTCSSVAFRLSDYPLAEF